jgi:GAF domain-containing protein
LLNSAIHGIDARRFDDSSELRFCTSSIQQYGCAHVTCMKTPEFWPGQYMDARIRSTPSIANAAPRVARRTVREIARRTVPALADFCVVFVVAGRTIAGIASAHADPDGDRLVRALQRVYRIRRADLHSTVAQVIRTGRPSLRTGIVPESQLRPVPRGGVADLHRRLACRSALVVPIHVGPEMFGAVSLCYAESGRTYTRADMSAGRRVALEIARAVAPPDSPNGALRLRPTTRHARRGSTVRRRVDSRN